MRFRVEPILYIPLPSWHSLNPRSLIFNLKNLHQDVLILINIAETACKTHSGFVLDSGLFRPKAD